MTSRDVFSKLNLSVSEHSRHTFLLDDLGIALVVLRKFRRQAPLLFFGSLDLIQQLLALRLWSKCTPELHTFHLHRNLSTTTKGG
jgi:hypothetical protein